MVVALAAGCTSDDGETSVPTTSEPAPVRDLGAVAQECLGGSEAACGELEEVGLSPVGALATAFVEAVMAGDAGTAARLSAPGVVAGFAGEGPYPTGEVDGIVVGVDSIATYGRPAFTFYPYPGGATICTVTGTLIESCIVSG